jgi:hypothetical protein
MGLVGVGLKLVSTPEGRKSRKGRLLLLYREDIWL